MLAGCAGPLDASVRSLNSSQVFLAQANAGIAELHRQERDQAVEAAPSAPEALVATKAVHARFAPAWAAYRRARGAWIAAAAAVQAAQAIAAAGGTPSPAALLRVLSDLAAALTGVAVPQASVAP